MTVRRRDAEWESLRTARAARLATVDNRGFPSVVPFCFAVLDSTGTDSPCVSEPLIVSVLDEKSKHVPDADLARVRNIQRHPEVGFVIDHYSEDWSALSFVQGKGMARLVAGDDPLHGVALNALRAKYPQYRSMNLTERPVIAISTLQLHSWRANE